MKSLQIAISLLALVDITLAQPDASLRGRLARAAGRGRARERGLLCLSQGRVCNHNEEDACLALTRVEMLQGLGLPGPCHVRLFRESRFSLAQGRFVGRADFGECRSSGWSRMESRPAPQFHRTKYRFLLHTFLCPEGSTT